MATSRKKTTSAVSLGFLPENTKGAVPLVLLDKRQLPEWLSAQPAFRRKWLESTGFVADVGQIGLYPAANGSLGGVVVGVEDVVGMWSLAHLPTSLPAGTYKLEGKYAPDVAAQLLLGWSLGSYRFTQYLKPSRGLPELVAPKNVNLPALQEMASAIQLVRDLINRPANDLGTDELAAAGLAVAKRFGAKTKVLRGDELVKHNYPAIYEVGKASPRPPQLLDFTWGDAKHPKLTLVGKGVVFDTGGLHLKPGNSMNLMKKDMGGAAHVLALASLVMAAKLPVRLRVLVPMAENSVAGNAFRPHDIIKTRAGLTVEIGSTDAEGRLLLADALAEGVREKPDMIIDFATLTGAGWNAVGPHMGTFFGTDDAVNAAVEKAAVTESDPLWRFPLWQPYAKSLNGKICDLSNTGSLGTAGHITAALFLERFIPKGQRWLHFDVRGWNESPRPGRPEGGEAMGLRAMYRVIADRYKAK